MCGSDLFLAILAVFFPPVAVWIKLGICTADSIINLALCCLGYVPGLLHAWYIILKYPEPDYDDLSYEPFPNRRGDVENGHVTYYYVSHQSAPSPPQRRGYGTLPPQQASDSSRSQSRQAAPKPQHEQDAAGSSSHGHDNPHPPPTYAEAVKGDNKVQNDD